MMFSFGCLKKSSTMSLGDIVAIVAVMGFFISCNNPFTTNMGERPVWERPVISNISPASNDFLTGEVRFQGEAWAHRELWRIEVRIGRNTTEDRTEEGRGFDDEGNPLLDWTDITQLGGSLSQVHEYGGVSGSWEFTLNTLALPENAMETALDDGFVRIMFRVFDNTPDPAMSQELVYNVKNLPSQITMSLPADEAIKGSVGEPFRIAIGAPIQGRVTDPRGLAPGYPMIQVWPIARHDITSNPDSFANDERYGLVSMFLTTLAPVGSVNDDIGTGYYASRDGRSVNLANFQFRLNSFTIAPPRDDNVREAIFDDELMAGGYLFRIITRDAKGIVGHFPPYGYGNPDLEDRSRRGDPVAIYVIGDATPPLIEIDNSDIDPEALEARPNIYVTTGINDRIIALDDPNAPGRPVFRLRTMATHSEGIYRAELNWEHRATDRQGVLMGNFGEGPWLGESLNNNRTEVVFTFTADQDTRDDSGNLIFTTHPTPYILTLKVLSGVGSLGERSFSLIMDGDVPTVEIRPSIRGAVAPPVGNRLPMHGGYINNNHITVNGNIHVSVDRASSPPIMMIDNNNQMVKWFAEPIPAGPGFDLHNPPPNSILARLIAFRDNPSQDNLAFFFDSFDGSSGFVNMPISAGSAPHVAYSTHNFKLDTFPYDGQDLWLYVVAMNQVYNLGFAMQRIRVDQNTDIPGIDIPGFFPIEDPKDLDVTVSVDGNLDAPEFGGNWPRRNVLSGSEGISIRVSDDDGINRDAEHITITLTDSAGNNATLTTEQLGEFLQGSPMAWSGTFDQSLMARILGHGDGAGVYRLLDGVYRLNIEVRDNVDFKVVIDGNPGQQRSNSESFWFAVRDMALDVTVVEPLNNSLQSVHGIDVVGTVRSPFRLQGLWITFTPDVIDGHGSYEIFSDESYVVIDGNNYRRFKVTEPVGRDMDGLYTYYWRVRNVSFTTGPGDPGPERRDFTLMAFDSLGFMNTIVPNWVRVDVDPPTLRFTGFNQGRPLGPNGDEFEIWGNVHFSVNVTDVHGLGSEPLPAGVTLPPGMIVPEGTDSNRLANVRWWLLPVSADSPAWDDAFPTGAGGRGGHFLFRDDLSATYEAVFNSLTLTDGAEYKLYVIARDAAGNEWRERLYDRGIDRIRVNQSADLPDLARSSPVAGTVLRPDAAGNLRITGLARDTDGFAATMVNNYVEIQFYDGGTWSNWVSVPGVLDGTGAIDFAFHVITGMGSSGDFIFNANIPDSLRGDGEIIYRLRISDEPHTTEGRTRSKNPQINVQGETIVTFLTGNSASVPTIPFMSSRYYERLSGFTLDTVIPEIIGLPSGPTPLFRNIADLLEVFPGGTVNDENLLFFDITFGNNTIRLLDDSSASPDWNWNMIIDGEIVANTLAAWFNGSGQGRQTITFVAEDMAGNRTPSMNWDFIKDTVAPTVIFTGFNQGRPINMAHEFEVWGNVHFAINVTDANGLGSAALPPGVNLPSGTGLSDLRWWLLPVGDLSPGWGTPFPTGHSGTGGQFLAQDGAVFEAVFDSTTLADNTVYKLYIIARDVVGNERVQRLNEGGINTIRVRQDSDTPVLSGILPGVGTVLRPDVSGNLRISGIARDTDGFDPARVGNPAPPDSHVQIRLSLDGVDWGNPIPVPGTIDSTGAINFAFDVFTGGARNIPGMGDGPIHYRISVSDEPDIPGRTRNKNPQLNVYGDPIHTFLTGDNVLPYIPVVASSVAVFNSNFILDKTPPDIVLPVGSTSLFGSVAGLREAFPGGTVNEENLLFFDVIFGGATFRLLDGPVGLDHFWEWDMDAYEVGALPSNRVNALSELADWLDNRAVEGQNSITFVAEDRAGNRSSRNWDFVNDRTPPTVRFSSFNQGRPVNAGNEFEMWGNVHFAINVTDTHGLGSVDMPTGLPTDISDERLSNVKWWLLPIGADSPQWHDAFPSGHAGTGGRFFARGALSASFEAVFDSTTLADNTLYKLYIIARDAAGNEVASPVRLDEGGINTIRVRQGADTPVLSGLLPGVGTVLRPDASGNLRITGVARDTDGFDPARVGNSPPPDSHVQIRFSSNGVNWDGDWIPVPGALDGTGAINFAFDVFTGGLRNVPGAGDGAIYYQVRIRDADIPDSTRNKNPQIAVGNTFLTGYPVLNLPVLPLVGYGEYVHVSRFVLDTTPPGINITYGTSQRTFRSVGDLLSAIPGGDVIDENLLSLYVSFGGTSFRLSDWDTGPGHVWNWNMEAYEVDVLPPLRAKILTELTDWFDNRAGQGEHTITLVAEDGAGNRSAPSNWNFVKDTEGPNLALLGGMRRAILHNNKIAGSVERDISPDDFPPDWPLDWPNGTVLAGGDIMHNWHGWPQAFRDAIKFWPSDFAFIGAAYTPEARAEAVLARIEHERNLLPTVFRNTDDDITGRFDDRLGTVWDASNNANLRFYFTRPNELPPGDPGLWSELSFPRGNQHVSSLSWEIPLAGLDDGEHNLNIRFSDTAGNETVVYRIRFLVDTMHPYFSVEDPVAIPNTPSLFTVRLGGVAPDFALGPDRLEWVFSAAGAAQGGNATVFQVRGRVNDANLQQLAVTVSGGSHEITAWALTPVSPEYDEPPRDYENDSPSGYRRLALTQVPGGNYWDWTLDLLERDVYALKGIPGESANISFVAKDVANRRTTVQWPFFLDHEGPQIHFDLESQIYPVSGLVLRGSAHDTTGIMRIQFTLAQWNYEYGEWEWFDGSGFNAGYALESGWRDVAPFPIGSRSVNWIVPESLIRTVLDNTPVLTGEGKYRIEVRAWDGSLGWGSAIEGNPVNTIDTYGIVASERLFFIDSGAPEVLWTGANGERQFFNNANEYTQNFVFEFTVADGNTVLQGEDEFSATILDGTTLVRDVTKFASFGGNTWDTTRIVTLCLNDPYRLTGLIPNHPYALALTVQDAAGNTARVTRNFFWGNTAPDAVVDTPAEPALHTIPRAPLAGPVTIRGRSPGGSGGIADVAFTLLPPGTTLPADMNLWDDNDWDIFNNMYWRRGATPSQPAIWMEDTDRELMRMREYPGLSWTIDIPNTRNIVQSTNPDTMALAPVVPFAQRPPLIWGMTERRDADGTLITDADGNLIMDPRPIPETEDVHQLRLAIRTEDLAGNVGFAVRDFWLYPEGDRPLVEIRSPVMHEEAFPQLSGPFTIMGMASDNERVQDVFFRVWRYRVDGTSSEIRRLSVPDFDDDGGGDQPIEGTRIPGLSEVDDPYGGWYKARINRQMDTDWSAMINANDELAPDDRGRNMIRIEVRAVDAARLSPIDTAPGPGFIDPWDYVNPMVSVVQVINAFVVNGAPIIEQERIGLTSRGPGPDYEWIIPSEYNWRSPLEVHMGLGRSTFRFTVRHEYGIASIRFQDIDANLQPVGREINILDASDPYRMLVPPEASNDPHFERDFHNLNAAMPTGRGIAVRAERVCGTPETEPGREFLVYVEVHTQLLATRLGKANSAFWLPLRIVASDISEPNPNEWRNDVRLPIDNSPPHAVHELNVWPASMATLGGSAVAGVGDVAGSPGEVDRVVVWFQRAGTLAGGDASSADDPAPNLNNGFEIAPGASWGESNARGASWFSWNRQFRWGETVNVSDKNGVVKSIRLPYMPQPTSDGAIHATSGGDYAIVIDRNDPLRNQPIRWGNMDPRGGPIARGWVPGGHGQIWNFTIDTTRLPSGPLDMHFVVFDRAGNAFHDRQRITVMNYAPFITGLQLATDILGSAALQVDVAGDNATWNHDVPVATRPSIFERIRYRILGAEGLVVPETERDIRGGIAETMVPSSHTNSSAITGARHRVNNFTVRNNFFALSVTTPPAHQASSRNFRVEYVSGATLRAGNDLLDRIRSTPGKVFIVQNPGDVSWLAVGANHASVSDGYAFLAGEIPIGLDWGPASASNAPSAWELNHGDLQLDTQVGAGRPAAGGDFNPHFRAEFAYGSNAFTLASPPIIDYDPDATLVGGTIPWHLRESLFIVKVFDNNFADLFVDFTLLSIRVNNNDRTEPFAQLYDLNPRAEHQVGSGDTPSGIAPEAMGQNRTRGGLWRNENDGNLSRPGHIEPRRIPLGNGNGFTHSLSGMDMGQDNNDPERVSVDAFFEVDTVSGRVVLRGYAEDDQRVGGLVLEFRAANGGGIAGDLLQRVAILESDTGAQTPGLLRVPRYNGGWLDPGVTDRTVLFTETIDLYRHRVEWAFVWDTASFPNGFVVGDLVVRAIAVNANASPVGILTGPLPTNTSVSTLYPVGADAGTGTATQIRHGISPAARSHVNMRNFGFPANLQMYNSIRVNVRPYITGFERNTRYGNIRSMQGHYAFYRGGVPGQQNETVVVSGFNLGGGRTADTVLVLPRNLEVSTGETSGDGFGITTATPASHRQFEVPQNAGTGDGLVRLRVECDGGMFFYAVNTGGERPTKTSSATPTGRMNGDWWVQPWNVERSLNANGSDLWDNVTRVHIWQSNNNTSSGNHQGAFRRTGTTLIHGASMSINPSTGVLRASHNEGRSANGMTHLSDNAGGNNTDITLFVDPIIQSNIFVDEGGDPWVVSSIIGRNAALMRWDTIGGVFLHGPRGGRWDVAARVGNPANNSLYHVQSNWYRASNQSARMTTPPADEQFRNPSIVVSGDHVHVAYFDSENNSINYRYNQRGQDTVGNTAWGLGTINTENAGGTIGAPAANSPYAVRRLWTNIDGGTDHYDYVQAGPSNNPGIGGSWLSDSLAASLGPGTRVVAHPNPNPATGVVGRSVNAGYHNDIAVTSQGFPVIIYFDAANQRLRMAISDSTRPIAGSHWTIAEHVIPMGNPAASGTGLYVSMRIDTRPNDHTPSAARPDGTNHVRDTVHIAAFNPSLNSLVYVMGEIVGTEWRHRVTQVVDNVGNVGRRSTISLDEYGRPWIAYLDAAGGRLKAAFFDSARFTRNHIDRFGEDITGWETMHVPARWRVEDHRGLWSSQLGMENFPTRNVDYSINRDTFWWRAAVAFLADDGLFRIAYWVE